MPMRCHLLMLHIAKRIIEQANEVFSLLHFDWKTLLKGNITLCCPVPVAISIRSIEVKVP
jgi:hypothetical protein